MVRVEITNFESIEHAVVEIDGFTTVQGPNYTGKSAAMRAINFALTNPSGTWFISWWATFCEVRIQSENLDLLWHKEEGNNFYEINGTKYSKIGAEAPPAELAALRYGTVKLNGAQHNLYYADQFDVLFMVDEQNTKSMDLITSAYGLDRLYKAQELCSKDQRSTSALMKLRRKDLEFATSDLSKYDGLNLVIEQGNILKESLHALAGRDAKILKAKEWSSTMTQTALECNKIKAVGDVTLPDPGDLSDRSNGIVIAASMLERMCVASAEVSRLSAVKDILMPDPEDLPTNSETLKDLLQMWVRLSMAQAEVDRLVPCVGVFVPDNNELKAMTNSMDSLSMLKGAMRDFISYKNEFEQVKCTQKETEDELSVVEREKAEFGTCPLCGSKI